MSSLWSLPITRIRLDLVFSDPKANIIVWEQTSNKLGFSMDFPISRCILIGFCLESQLKTKCPIEKLVWNPIRDRVVQSEQCCQIAQLPF